MEEFRDRWQHFRDMMPVAEKLAYFDHAAVSPLSAPARDALVKWAEQSVADGDTVWPQWERRVRQVRSTAADLIHADPREITLVPNTTAGINLVAEGYPWREGDNVVVMENEFPSNLYPWLNLARRGVETRRVAAVEGRVDVRDLFAACDSRTRLISLSWVGYATGWRIDVAEIAEQAHRRGILLLLDAIQGLGVFPLDVQACGVDFLAADGHKWMLGPEGAGIFYLRHEHLNRLVPRSIGWNSVVRAHDFDHVELELRPDAARFEGGSQNMPGIAALGASLDLLVRLGLNYSSFALAERVLELRDLAAEQLRSIGGRLESPEVAGHRSGILAFTMPGHDQAAVRQHCLQAGVVLSVRHGWLRIAPHAYNNAEDIQRLVSAITDAARH